MLDKEKLPLQFAAQELQRYLKAAAPAELQQYLCEIRVGNGEAPYIGSQSQKEQETAPVIMLAVCAELASGPAVIPALDDCVRVDIHNLSGIIQGSNPRAVLLGVYRYLFHLGFRFLRPGKEYEILPELRKLSDFDASFVEKARKRHRGSCIEGADSLENITDFIDWLPKIGCNSFFLQFQSPYSFLNRWYVHQNNPLHEPQELTMEQSDEMSGRIDLEMEKRGLLHHRVGHGWTAKALGQSGLGWMDSDAALPQELKDFPALIDGKREFFCGIPSNTNLCYSNPRVIRSFVEGIADYASAHPYIQYLHVWLADDYNNQCECERCREKLPTDHYIHILNELDLELTRRKLETRIVMLIYMDLLWAPDKEHLQNPDRFVLMFAPISRTFTHTYSERGERKEIPVYQRNQITLPTGLEENLSFLEAWQHSFKGDSFVYDYHLGRAHYGDPGYIQIAGILYEDIGALDELGLNGMIACQELRAFLPNALPDYVMGHALFGSEAGFEGLTADYFRHAYGTEWESCLQYLTKLSSFYNCDYFNKKGDRINSEVAEAMENALEHLRNADWIDRLADNFHGKETLRDYLSQSPTDVSRTDRAAGVQQCFRAAGVQQRFLEHLVYHRQYCIRLTEALLALSLGRQAEAAQKWEAFKDYIRRHEELFQGCLDVYRIIEVGTNYTGFPK